jgi:hypothetical protein
MIRRFYNFMNRNWWQMAVANALLIAILAVLLILSSCTSQREDKTDGTITGVLNGQPVSLQLDMTGTATTKTTVDPVIIEEACRRAAAAVASQIPGLDAIKAMIGPIEKPGFTGLELGGLAAAGSTGLLALAKMLEARMHKKDGDEAWDIIKNASDPKSVTTTSI